MPAGGQPYPAQAPAAPPAPQKPRRTHPLNESLAGERVELWHARLDAAERAHEKNDALREVLRRIVSELDFGTLMGPAVAEDDTISAEEYAHVEQYDLNLILRFVNKLRAHASDEEPEIRTPRDRGRTTVADAEDRLLTRVMAIAGGPEVIADSVGLYSTDGNCALWVLMPNLPTKESLEEVRKSVREIVAEAGEKGMGVEPALGQDKDRIASALQQAALSDPEALLVDAVVAPLGGPESPIDKMMAAALKYAHAAAKERKKRIGWDQGDGMSVLVEIQPLGKNGTLIDPTSPRCPRWMARRLDMDIDEAHNHPHFHPDVRKDIKPQPIDPDGRDGTELVRPTKGVASKEIDKENSRAVVYEIWDLYHHARHYVSREVDRYLETDESYPYVDEAGNDIIKPIAGHPGFFPCVFEPLMKGVRRNAQRWEGIPIAAPGLASQLAIIKLLSYYLHAVKQSSASVYLTKLDDELLKPVKQAIPGTILQVDAGIEDIEDALAAVEWKPPPAELFREIDREIARFGMALNFPLIELTSQPSGETLGQDQLSSQAGDLGTMEIVQRLQHNYALMVAIARAYVQHYYTPDALFGLSGREGLALKIVWEAIGTPPEIPAIRFASRARDLNPVNLKQQLDLYELLKDDIDPITMLPTWDLTYIPNQVAQKLGLGELPPFASRLDKLLQIKQQMEAKGLLQPQGVGGGQPGQPGQEEGGPPGQQPSGPGGPPQANGKPGTAHNRRDQDRGPARRRGEAPNRSNMEAGVRNTSR